MWATLRDVGYGYVGDALNGNMAFKLMVLLVAVAMSYASANAGGIFGPALFIGAMLGGSVGTIAHNLFPACTATPGCLRIGRHGHGLCWNRQSTTPSLSKTASIYRRMFRVARLGLGSWISCERHFESLPAEIKVHEAISQVQESKHQSWLVTEEDSRVLGVVNLTALQQNLGAGDSRSLRDLVNDVNFPHVHADQSLDIALERMGINHVQVLPVVSRADVRNLLGVVTLSDVMESYGLGIPESDVS